MCANLNNTVNTLHFEDSLQRDIDRLRGKITRMVGLCEHALRQSKHDLRVALVMLKTGISAAQARKKLSNATNSLRKALGE